MLGDHREVTRRSVKGSVRVAAPFGAKTGNRGLEYRIRVVFRLHGNTCIGKRIDSIEQPAWIRKNRRSSLPVVNLGRSASHPCEATFDPPCIIKADTLKIDGQCEDKRRAEKRIANFATGVAQEGRIVLVKKRIVLLEAEPIPVSLC
jgi:hypothetical protein